MDKPEDDNSGKEPVARREGVGHDSRGNAVWQWAAESGKHLVESASQVLRRLDVPGLKLEEDASAQYKKPDAEPGAPELPKGDAGYDPYGGKRATPAAAARPAATPRAAVKKPAAVPPPRRSLWRRLTGRG